MEFKQILEAVGMLFQLTAIAFAALAGLKLFGLVTVRPEAWQIAAVAIAFSQAK